MVLVDTSIWISHFKHNNPHLKKLLMEESVSCHPIIIGELACGNIKNRKEIISLLQALPQTLVAESDEILAFIEHNKLMGVGIGLVDVHLLASSLLTNLPFWTTDKRLCTIASKFNILYR
jgi:predicted nucleic acid-binding protein